MSALIKVSNHITACIGSANHVPIKWVVVVIDRIPKVSSHADLNFHKSLFGWMWIDSMEQASRIRGFCVYLVVDARQVWVP
jgi:hypothetical protein